MKLGDIVTLKRGKTYKSSLLGDVGVPLLGLATIEKEGGFRDGNFKRYSGDSDSSILVQGGEIYASLKDVTQNAFLLGSVARLPKEVGEGRLTQDTVLLRREDKSVDGSFLYWVMRAPQTRSYYKSFATGTTNLGLARDDFLSLEIPDMTPERNEIVKILDSIDELIRTQRKSSKTLEDIAKALFKSWFVDFDPVRAKAEGRPTGLPDEISELFPDSFEESELGEIPSGWDVKTIGDIAEVIDCLHSKKPEKLDEGSLMLQLNNIRNDGLLDVGDQFLISDNDYQKWTSRMEAREGDCVVTNVGRVGAVAQIPEGVKAALGRNMTGVRGKHTFKFHTFILEYLLSSLGREEIRINIDEGTILNALNVKSIPKLRFALPSGHLLEKYEVIGRSFRRRMEMLLLENSLLCDLRDALLLRLISGELKVPDAEKMLEEASV